jgi:hypothetical protein
MESITIPDFKLYFRAKVKKKTAWYWCKIDMKINGTEHPYTKPKEIQSFAIFKRSPKHTLKKRQTLQQMLLRKLDIHL